MEPVDPALGDGPPADPEEWTDEEWIHWLEMTDADSKEEGDAPPATTAGRVTHSTGSQLLGQAMLGMANAIYGPKDDDIVVVAEGDSEPNEDEPFTVHLDPDHPERSSVVFKRLSEPPV